MSDSFLEAVALLIKAGFGAEVVIVQGEGMPAVQEKNLSEKVRSITMDANGVHVWTFSGRCLTPENAPNIAHYTG